MTIRSQHDRLVIRARPLGTWGYPLIVGIVIIGAPLTAVVSKVWLSRPGLMLWLIFWAVMVATFLYVVLVTRRTCVEVAGGQIRWMFRPPRVAGEGPLGNVVKVEIFPESIRVLVIGGGFVIGIDEFTRRDLNRLVATLRSHGVAVEQGVINR